MYKDKAHKVLYLNSLRHKRKSWSRKQPGKVVKMGFLLKWTRSVFSNFIEVKFAEFDFYS